MVVQVLEPNTRTLLHDALRPPDGFELDTAVGTTYSLDLIAMLSTPVSFALFDLDTADVSADSAGLEILESVRRYADRITVFTMAGQVSVPAAYRSVLVYCENSIIQVRRPREHRVFHPKVWVLRFRDPSTGDFRHRVLVLSRNLTYDRSWDISLRVDEADGESGVACAGPLSEFLRELPSLSTEQMSAERFEQIESLATSLEDCRLEVPRPFVDMEFLPIGITSSKWPFPEFSERTLVISPFLSGSVLSRIQESTKRLQVVSRPEELDALPVAQLPDEALVLSPYADSPDESDSATLRGLHAKVYVMESGKRTQWWLGSANATTAAFHGNAEMLVRLEGSTNSVGISGLLAPSTAEPSLRSILEEYVRDSDAPSDGEVEPRSVEEELLIDIAVGGLRVKVGAAQKDPNERDIYPVSIETDVIIPSVLQVSVRPLSLPAHGELRPLRVDMPASWSGLSLQSITPYVVVQIQGDRAADRIQRIVLATLIDAPAHRREVVLAQIIADQAGFLRYLLLLLADGGFDQGTLQELARGLTGGEWKAREWGAIPLLESLLRTLSRNPAGLLHVNRLLEDLRQTEEGSTLIPTEFQATWEPISAILTELLSTEQHP
jgi:hypothetical protein